MGVSKSVSFSGSDTTTPQFFFEEALFFILFLSDYMAFSWLRHGWSLRRTSDTGRLSERGSLTRGTSDTGGLSEGGSSLGRTSDFGRISKGFSSTDVTAIGRLSKGGSSLGRTSDIGGVSKEGLKILVMWFFATSAIVVSSSDAKFATLVSRISGGCFCLISLRMLWTMLSLTERDRWPAIHRCKSFGDTIQSGLCDTGGEYAQTLGGHVQEGASRKLPEALQGVGNYLYNHLQ